MYYGGETVTCYDGARNKTKTCPTGSLNDESKTMIEKYTWNTGAANSSELHDSTTSSLNTLGFYKAERGEKTGKICTGGMYCTDSVIRTTTWTGYVALPYVTDWAYASSESDCETKIDNSSTYKCKNNNWMQRSSDTWYLSPSGSSVFAIYTWGVCGGVRACYSYACYPVGFSPAIYLKSNVLFESGTGSETNPYILSMQ